MSLFENRRDAGRQLALELSSYADRPDVIVLALPRGGVPVAYEVARALNAPLDIFLVNKLSVPAHEELAFGAVASGDIRELNEEVVWRFNLYKAAMDAVAQRELSEMRRRERDYRRDRPAPRLRDCTAILVDDGLATGASMRAAVAGVQANYPAWIVLAVPVAEPETCELFEAEVDEIACAKTPELFYRANWWYRDNSQTSDEEVRMFLAETSQGLDHNKEFIGNVGWV